MTKNKCDNIVTLNADKITSSPMTIRQPEYATYKIDKSKIKTVNNLLEIMEAFNMTTYTIDISEKGNKKLEIVEKYMEKV